MHQISLSYASVDKIDFIDLTFNCTDRNLVFNIEVSLFFFLDGDSGCSLEDLLSFMSGADTIPPYGFPVTPTLIFLHHESTLPTASTCDLILRLPACYNYKQYGQFKDAMILGLKGHDGFGGVKL